jgi:hypothetical protein
MWQHKFYMNVGVIPEKSGEGGAWKDTNKLGIRKFPFYPEHLLCHLDK